MDLAEAVRDRGVDLDLAGGVFRLTEVFFAVVVALALFPPKSLLLLPRSCPDPQMENKIRKLQTTSSLNILLIKTRDPFDLVLDYETESQFLITLGRFDSHTRC